ncbi:MAG: hypothetical protein QXN51_05170 [Ignisphaera sp.]
MSDLMEYIGELEEKLENILKEKDAKEISFVDIYHDPHAEWDYKILWRIFDLLVQVLFPESNIERIELPTDTPFDKYHIELKDIIEKLSKCNKVLIIREYDTLYYCVM